MNTRRLTARLAALVIAISAAIAAISVAALGERFGGRLDLTRGDAHRLSGRGAALLADLRDPVEIAFALRRGGPEAPAVDRALDAIEAVARDNAFVRLTVIDPDDARGPEQLTALEDRLRARDGDAYERDVALLASVEARSRPLIDACRRAVAAAPGPDQRPSVSTELGTWQSAIRELPPAFQRLGELFSAEEPPADPAGRVRELAGVLELVAEQASVVATNAAGEYARAVRGIRDEAAGLAAALGRVRTPDAARVASALETGETVLVIGPAGRPRAVAAIDPNEIIPDGLTTDRLGEIGPRAERLVTTAIASTTRGDAPIVVLTHAEASPFAPSLGGFVRLADRLRGRGIDVQRWHVDSRAGPPPRGSLDPDGTRPVVYLAFSPDTSQGGTQLPSGTRVASGAERAALLASKLRERLARGEGVLLTGRPSVLPTFGDTDPLAELSAEFGIDLRPGSAIVTPVTVQGASGVATALTFTPPGELAHPIAGAVSGLPTTLDWPLVAAPSQAPPEGVTAEPLLRVESDGRRWAESQWLGVWQAGQGESRLIGTVPTFDEALGETRGPWTVAAAGERAESTQSAAARLVVVGANNWAADDFWSTTDTIDGRPALVSPGNIELLEASVEWLARRDALIAASDTARPISLVRPVSGDTLRWLRWGLMGGLPALILLAGGLYRLLGR